MPLILLGAVALVALLWVMNLFAKADPKLLVPVVRRTGGIGALAGAAFLALRGQFGIAVPLGFAGLGLLGIFPKGMGSAKKTPGQVSRVRSAFLEMELEHDSGALRGRILAGPYEGITLDALDMPTLLGFLDAIDAESRALLMTYLDRREPAWRENTQAGAAAGQAPSPGGKMTEQEAYQILGVHAGASAEEIGRAHRTLMKKLHPDQGGSTYLAARVNEAKEILLRRHR